MANILLAETAEPIRMALATALADSGHSIVAVADRERAVSELRRLPFDLMVMNLWLPPFSGFDVLRHVRKAMPALKTVVLVNHVDHLPNLATSAAIAQALGADAIVHPPFGPDDILKVTGDLLDTD